MSRRTPLPSGLSCGLDFLIDTNWSPEQALAVYELLNDLRTRIWLRYGEDVIELIRRERWPAPNLSDINDLSEPF
ncbi:hypothetical protein [Paraburkholderia tagetis]|jgi:hypothetical protein|uniref:Uncharacterized protein n=1 Tax=Paraburkholderia tagetis TaxID=2913261 RepID=A0A9X1RRW7_9BURK|nr:hypothetical protein [Paraburkholderia tagetis]MCG5077101.1 hypothetical protein [Paraburkholderia tagetis]